MTIGRSESQPVDPELGDVDCAGYDLGGQSCSSAWVWIVTAGCVHEHLGARALCKAHHADLRHGWMLCGDCLSHPSRPHECTLAIVPGAKAGEPPS